MLLKKKNPINSVVSIEVKRKEGWRATVKELESVGGEDGEEGLMARNWADLLPAEMSCGIARTQVGHSDSQPSPGSQQHSHTSFVGIGATKTVAGLTAEALGEKQLRAGLC